MRSVKKNKKGFTLVECIVAMAVLAIMSLLLTMILSVAVKARNVNMQIEKSIDSQLEKIAGGQAGAVSEECNSGIKLENGAWSETIPGNSAAGVSADKKYYENEDAEIGFLDYNFDGYDFSKAGGVGHVPDPSGGDEEKKYKSYGSASIDASTKINITDNTKSISGGTEVCGIAENADHTYTVTWTIKTKFTEIAPERAIMLRLPTGAGDIRRVSITDKCDLYLIQRDVIRVGCTKDTTVGDITAKISFRMSKEDLEAYHNVSKYFTGTGETNNVIIDLGIEA